MRDEKRGMLWAAIGLVLIALVLMSGCGGKVVAASPVKIEAVGNRAAATVEVKVRKVSFLCAGITKAGKACRNPVKREGDKCHLHLHTDYKEGGLNVPCTTDTDCEKNGR